MGLHRLYVCSYDARLYLLVRGYVRDEAVAGRGVDLDSVFLWTCSHNCCVDDRQRYLRVGEIWERR